MGIRGLEIISLLWRYFFMSRKIKYSKELKLEIVKKFIGIPPLLIGVFVSIHWMLFAWIISGLLSYYLNAYYSGRLLNYSFNENRAKKSSN